MALIMAEPYKSSWHFPRTMLAESYLLSLKQGAPTMAIFAQRRHGKTEFLTHDMTPLAESEGHLCISGKTEAIQSPVL